MFGNIDTLIIQRLPVLINEISARLDRLCERLWLGALIALFAVSGLSFYKIQENELPRNQAYSPGGIADHDTLLNPSEPYTNTLQVGHVYLPNISRYKEPVNRPDLKVMIWDWQGCETCAADLRSNFNQALDAYRESSGKTVELIVVDPHEYHLQLNTLLRSDLYPDLFWITQEMLRELVEERDLMSLDELYAAHPEVAADLPEASLPRFRLNDHLFGIPLGPAEEWNWNAYSISRRTLVAGKAELAFDLLRFLRARVPPHGLPELIMERLKGEPDEVPIGETFEFSAVIRNVGEANAEHVVVAFFNPEGDMIEDRVINFLAPGEAKETTVPVVQDSPNLKWYSVQIDPQGLISEANKRNNIGSWATKASGTGTPPTPAATSQPFCIDSKAYQSSVNGMGPKVAFDGTNYLVVWAKQQFPFANTYAHQIYGARVSPSGTVIDTNGFVIASTVAKYNAFSLAFDGTNYLVVWELEKSGVGGYGAVDPATIIYGARVSKAGSVLDNPPIVIEKGSTPATNNYPSQLWHRWPVVVYTGSDFLVVYHTSTYCGGCSVVYTQDGVYARRISKTGVVGAKQQLVQSLSNKTYYDFSDLAFKQTQAFLFMNGASGTPVIRNIFGSWVSGFSASKFTVTTPLKLASNSPANTWPFGRGAVAAGNTNQYLAVWEYSLNKSYPDLHFGIASNSTFSNKTALMKGIRETYPSIAFDGTNYLTVYSHTVGCKAYLGAIHVSTLGVPGKPTYFNPSTTWADLVYDTDVAFGSTNFLAVFANMHPASSNGAGDWYMQVCGQLVQKSP